MKTPAHHDGQQVDPGIPCAQVGITHVPVPGGYTSIAVPGDQVGAQAEVGLGRFLWDGTSHVANPEFGGQRELQWPVGEWYPVLRGETEEA